MSLNAGDIVTTFIARNKSYLNAVKQNIASTKEFTENAVKNMKAVSKQADATGKAMTLKLTVPLTAALGASAAAFLSFDDKMTESLSIMGNVNEEMRMQLEQTAKQISGESIFAASELAESYFFLASAGLSAKEAIGALPIVAAFATAGAFNLSKATDLLTDAQSALGLTTDDTAQNMINMVRVSDVLVRANTLANASVLQFSESLTNRAGPALRLLNKDLEEGVAVLAVFADQGIKGARAGEALGIVLRDLQRSALSNRQAFKDNNIAVFDAAGNMRNIAKIVRDLEKRMKGLSDAQKKATLTLLGFQERSQANLLALLGTSEQLEEYERQLRKAGGTTQEVADKQMTSMFKQLKVLKNIVTNTAAAFGKSFVPSVVQAAQAMVPYLNRLEKMEDSNKKLIVAIAAIVAAVGPLLVVFAILVQSITVLLPLFTALVVVLGASQLAMVGLTTAALALVGIKIGEWFLGIPEIEKDTNRLTRAQRKLALSMVKINVESQRLQKIQEQIAKDRAKGNITDEAALVKFNIRVNKFNLERLALEQRIQKARAQALGQSPGGGGNRGAAEAKLNAQIIKEAEGLKAKELLLKKINVEKAKEIALASQAKAIADATKDVNTIIAKLDQKSLKLKDPLLGELSAIEKRYQSILKILDNIILKNGMSVEIQKIINKGIEAAKRLREQELEIVKKTQQDILTDFILTEEQKTFITLREEKKRAEMAAKFLREEQKAKELATAKSAKERAEIEIKFARIARDQQGKIDEAATRRFFDALAPATVDTQLNALTKGSLEAVRAENPQNKPDAKEKLQIKIEKNTKTQNRLMEELLENGIVLNNIGIAEI